MATRVLRLRITGLVQGVGFRAFVQDQARRRGVRGWVRNCRDRSVEALVAGAPEAVGELLIVCRRGPPGSQVEEVSVDDAVSEPFGKSFSVLPTAP